MRFGRNELVEQKTNKFLVFLKLVRKLFLEASLALGMSRTGFV